MRLLRSCLISLALSPLGLAAQAPPATHVLRASPGTVAFGHYDPAGEPVLRVRSGDFVDVTTMLTNSPMGLERMGLPAAEVQPELRAIYEDVTDRGPGGHILTGPIWVEGAQPGDVLEVRILSVDLDLDYGYNGCGGFVRDLCDSERRSRLIRIDRAGRRAEIAPGIVVPLAPFFGSMGVAPPPDSGRVSSNPPGQHAGNRDNKELAAGTTLYIPVWVPGALFEVGDGHAVQGDGEVNQTALETSLRGRLQLTVRKGQTIDWPRAETPTHWILMGFDPNLTKATEIAIRETVEFLQERTGLTRGEAYSVVSMACDLRITELVDGNVAVHVMVAKTLLGARAQEIAAKPAGRHWQAVILPGADTLRFTIWVPEGIAGGAKVPLVLGAHFGGRVTPYMGGEYGDLLIAPGLEELGAVIVAPDAHSNRGWSPDDEGRLIWLVKALMKTYPIDPTKVVMTGFSAGGAQTWYIANRNQDLFTAVITVAAPIRQTPPNPWTIPVWVLHSTADQSVPIGPVQEYVASQRAAGAPVELHVVDGIPHNRTSLFAEPLRAAVPWLERVW